jgi:hypothetical protein
VREKVAHAFEVAAVERLDEAERQPLALEHL